MKPSYRVIIALAATLATGAYAQSGQPASASAVPSAPVPAGSLKIAIIAFQPAVAQTNEGQQAFKDIQQKFAPKQAELKAQSQEIDTLKKQLQAAGTTLSTDERASRLKTIDDKEKALQHTAQDAQTQFQQEMGEVFQKIAQKFDAVLQDYCKKNGYSMVTDISSQQSNVVYASRSLDITPAVIAAYNVQSGVAAPAKAAASAPSAATPAHSAAGSAH